MGTSCLHQGRGVGLRGCPRVLKALPTPTHPTPAPAAGPTEQEVFIQPTNKHLGVVVGLGR